MYVRRLVAFFFDFPKKWTADSEKQKNKLVWPNHTRYNFFSSFHSAYLLQKLLIFKKVNRCFETTEKLGDFGKKKREKAIAPKKEGSNLCKENCLCTN